MTIQPRSAAALTTRLGGTTMYSTIGRPGMGSNVRAPGLASKAFRSAAGNRTMTCSWCSPVAMLPFTKAAG
ncbi:MAG TPA: hypothetical protein VIK30_08005 [Polyangia bacterium]